MIGLTDTQTLIFATDDPSKLGLQARQALFDPANTIYFSVVNTWEIAIKRRPGKLQLSGKLIDLVEFARRAGFVVLPAKLDHTLEVENLPLHHNDSFDRLLIAQCNVENLALITDDSKIPPYGIPILW